MRKWTEEWVESWWEIVAHRVITGMQGCIVPQSTTPFLFLYPALQISGTGREQWKCTAECQASLLPLSATCVLQSQPRESIIRKGVSLTLYLCHYTLCLLFYCYLFATTIKSCMLLKQSKVCSFSLACVLSLSTYMYIHLLNTGNTTRGTYLLDNGILLF